MKQELALQEGKLIQEVKKETGIDTQIWAARSIAKVFEKLKLPYERTAKTQAPSFTKNFLSTHKHPLVQKIAKAEHATIVTKDSTFALERAPDKISNVFAIFSLLAVADTSVQVNCALFPALNLGYLSE